MRISLGSLLGVPVVGCQKAGVGANPNVDYYTCTMHPSVRSQDPHGKCPICSMDLVPVFKKGMEAPKAIAAASASEFTVPVERQQQIGVTYAAAERKPLRHTIRSAGIVALDKTRHWEFVARVEGYIQKLFVASPGESVAADQTLLTIYSPELLTAERELVNLLEARDRAAANGARTAAEQLIDAARRRLEQWNVTPQQIAELEKTRKPSEFLMLKSPFAGVVEDVPVDQGRKVMPGDHLVDVADLSVVWVWADFYQDEIAMLKRGWKATITSRAFPGRAFEGELALVDPFISQATRTARARFDLANPDSTLRPGMYVNIDFSIDMGEGLTVPVGAVMPAGSRSLVFVDKGEGKLEPRFITPGRKYGETYEVLGGLSEGESVVASANFLIDAESKVQSAVKSFEPAPAAAQRSSVTLPSDSAQPLTEAR